MRKLKQSKAVATLLIFALSTQAQAQSLAQDHLQNTKTLNRGFLSWFHFAEADKRAFMAKRGGDGSPPHVIDFVTYEKPVSLVRPSRVEADIALETKKLYDSYFPPSDASSYVGTWIESGHPYVETKYGPYQWNSHWGSGIDGLKAFEAAVKQTTALGIKNIRIGPNLHEIDPKNPASWDPFLDKIETIWKYGATPTISVVFFSSLTRWRVNDQKGNVDYERSYLLNPRWPVDMKSDSATMIKRLFERAHAFEAENPGAKARVVINPVNEPETLAGFNRHFWHGAHAPWGSPEMMKFYVPSLINIAKTNVMIRMGIEEQAGTERVLFMHNEAMTPAYYPSHNGYGRFALSKFMLGDRLFMTADMDRYESEPLSTMKRRLEAAFNPLKVSKSAAVNEVDWAFKEFVFGSWNKTEQAQEAARKKLVALFRDLQDTHKLLYKKTNKVMKTDNFLDLDYYCQGEFLSPMTIPQIVDRLSANKGEFLKYVMGTKDDVAFINALNAAARDAECELNGRSKTDPGQCLSGIDLSPGKDRASTDFRRFLTKEDNAVLYNLLAPWRKLEKINAPDLAERQKAFGLDTIKEELRRSDSLLRLVLADKAAGLRKALRVQTDQQLITELQKIALDTRDGGKPFKFNPSGLTLRQILNLNDRTVLHRLLGLKRNTELGFEPQHYSRQVRMGLRDGFYKTAVSYVNALRVFTIGVGESGTPFYVFAPLLHDQIVMDYAKVLEGGAYGTHYSFGPAVDTIGWDKGPLSTHYREDNTMSPTGIFRVMNPRSENPSTRLTSFSKTDKPWAETFLKHPSFGFLVNLKRFLPVDASQSNAEQKAVGQ